MDIAKDRPEALSLGLKYYYGNVCKSCDTNIKRVKKYDCLECHVANRKVAAKAFFESPKGKAYKRSLERLRRASMRSALVPWADLEKISEIYSEARKLGMHVDHIIPLKHELVCGLHNEFNLQLLPPNENMAKSNFFEVL